MKKASNKVDSSSNTATLTLVKDAAEVGKLISANPETLEGKVEAADVALYIASRMEAASGGMREACLAAEVAIRSGEEFQAKVKEPLLSQYSNGTVNNIWNVGRNILPLLRAEGLEGYRDVYNLRDVAKVLKDKDATGHSEVKKAIKDGLGLPKIKKALAEAKGEDDKPEGGSGSTGGSQDQIEKPVTTSTIGATKSAILSLVETLVAFPNGKHELMQLLNSIANQQGFTDRIKH
jgi:hypothetical protein